jgi:hypothetical protein
MNGRELILNMFLRGLKALHFMGRNGFFLPQNRKLLFQSQCLLARVPSAAGLVSTIATMPMKYPIEYDRITAVNNGACRWYTLAVPGTIAKIIIKYFILMPVFTKLYWRKNPEPGTC